MITNLAVKLMASKIQIQAICNLKKKIKMLPV